MLRPGEYADVLRVIGWTLDQRLDAQEAIRVEIVVRGASIAVTWQTMGSGMERQTYPAADLVLLREQARRLREGAASGSPGQQAEFLRTIGQHLDENGILLERLVKVPEGHRLTGVVNWRSLGQWYEPSLIQEMSEERRRLRKKQA